MKSLYILVLIDDLDGKLTQLEQIAIQNKKKVNAKKITGFQVTLPVDIQVHKYIPCQPFHIVFWS